MGRWQEIMPDRDRAIYEKAGFAEARPFGRTPALLVIDVTIGFIGRKPEDVLRSVEDVRTSCGEIGWATLPNIRQLLDACREKQMPIVFTTGNRVTRKYLSPVTKANIGMGSDEEYVELSRIPEIIAPRPSEWVLEKHYASAFFNTPLAAYLSQQGVDSVIVTGCVTSGCVRSTVTDSHSWGFRTFVVEECVFDRSEFSHMVNLYEMNAKYADVITLADAIEGVRKVER